MKLKRTSYFKDQQAGATAMQAWVSRLEATNVRSYTTQTVETALGQTVVYSLHTEHKNRPAFVIFPGFRTSSLYWDLDKGLDQLGDRFRIYMVETNGQPNLSDGHTPDIRGLDYGTWAGQIFEGLGLEAAYVAGASFGGLVALKMAIVHPGKIKACFLLASGGLQAFNFSFRNLYLNLLPVFSPKPKNIRKFLDRVVFHPPHHQLSTTGRDLLLQHQVLALTQYKDRTQKPYGMGKQLKAVKAPVYVLLGDKDIIFPHAKSQANAEKHISSFVEAKVFENVGHGIECHGPALQWVKEKIAGIEAR